MRLKIFFIIIVVLVVKMGFSQQIETDRPDQTESARVIPKGSLQIETGVYYEQKSNSSLEETVLLPTSLFRISLTNVLEIRIVSQLESVKFNSENSFGFSDLELGIKLQLYKKEGSKTEVALLQHVSVPTGNIGLSSSVVGIISKLLVSHEITNNFNIGYNVGYSNFNTSNGDFNYTFVGTFSINNKLSLYVEPFGSIIEMNDFIINIDAGLAYLVADNFQLDFSIASGLNQNMNYISAGFSWNISKD